MIELITAKSRYSLYWVNEYLVNVNLAVGDVLLARRTEKGRVAVFKRVNGIETFVCNVPAKGDIISISHFDT